MKLFSASILAATIAGRVWQWQQRQQCTKQRAYNASPLYFYFKDSKPGERLGEGIGGVWHLARP